MDTEDSAYLLHQRHLSDSRVVVELFTQHHGRIAAVWRRGKKQPPVQAFNKLNCLFYGNAELKNLKRLEALPEAFTLLKDALYCGLYLNEVLTRALAQEQPSPDIFELYAQTLASLQADSERKQFKSILRGFELRVLQCLGYGIDFHTDSTGRDITANSDCYYRFVVGEGFLPSLNSGNGKVYSGEVLSNISREYWRDIETENAAKQICRDALQQIIGEKPLKSRELYQQLKSPGRE